MRDRYLFRAKHSLGSKKWHIGNLVEEPDGLYLRDNKNNIMVYIQDPSTICQCTGLKDKNGKLIWENDIVLLDDEYWLVGWSDNDAQFTIEDDCTIEHFGNVWGVDCEVYGNLFDNPELMYE